ncbi:MAG: hypothetical protein U0075_09560 [Thermomicrobiales bacterium]
MDFDDLMVGVYCLIDETLAGITNGRRLRQRGPDPLLSDAAVLTMEVIGEFLGLDQDAAIFAHFRRHYAAWFPPLRCIHRTTFTRHAANLWAIKAQIWTQVVTAVSRDPEVALIDSFPMPVCRFARARRCRLFDGEAAFGHDAGARQTFYGVRYQPAGVAGRQRGGCPGSGQCVRARSRRGPGRAHHRLPDWGSQRLSPLLTDALAADGVCLLAPYRKASQDPDPSRSHYLSHIRYRIETVFGQLVERSQIKRIRARDLWHLQSRFMRKVLSHTVAILLNHTLGNPPRQLAHLLA